MTNLFDKALICTDIHFGKRQNDRQHNQDCDDFLSWVVKVGKERNVDTFIFCGDWHDTRHSIHVGTMNYTVENFEKLSQNFKNVYIIEGNHDLFYREKREWSSLVMGKYLSNVKLIDDFLTVGNVTFLPWLNGEDFKLVNTFNSKYIFGHLELPSFLMNAMVEMPDHGKENVEMFHKNVEYVFSGHFHKRQLRKNKNGTLVYYIGNCFPLDFGDAGDDERGAMFLEWDKEPEFLKWDKAPKYRVFNMSQIIDDPFNYIDDITYCKVKLDIPLSHEQIEFLKDTITFHTNARKLHMLPINALHEDVTFDDSIGFHSVDQVVVDSLSGLDSNVVDKELLIAIYNELN